MLVRRQSYDSRTRDARRAGLALFLSRTSGTGVNVAGYPVQVHYTVDKAADGGPPEGWKGSVGYVTKEMAKANIPPPSDDNLILVCGPPPMYKALSGEKAKDKSQGECPGLPDTHCASARYHSACPILPLLRWSTA